MMILVYDGSMAGIFTAIFEVYEYKWPTVKIAKPGSAINDAFADVRNVNTDKIKAKRVWDGLRKKLSAEAMRQLYWYYLSETGDLEDTILRYVQYAFSSTENIEQDFGHEAVLKIAQTVRKVGREKHRMEAFIRFQLTKDDIYYAAIEPDFNVLPLLIPHFKGRYADQHWLIYDYKRRYGLCYNKVTEQVEEVIINWTEGIKSASVDSDILQPGEEMYQLLWKDYFKSTGIPERKNMKLHIQHVPRRYWKYLTEKQL